MRAMRLLLSLFLLLSLAFSAADAPGEDGGKTWRVLYVEGGPYGNYQQTLAWTARGLERLGLIGNGHPERHRRRQRDVAMAGG